MNNPFFRREDFNLCDVPVPKGYPQSQTHAGVTLYDGKYYLASSPYPGKKYSKVVLRIRSLISKLSGGFLSNSKSGEVYENPCIYIGVSSNGEVPTKFMPLTDRPLMEIPEAVFGLPSYNSDPELFIEKGDVYILNRTVYRTKKLNPGYESITDVFLIKGSVQYEKFKLESIKLIKEWDHPFASPCLTKFKGHYIFTYLDTNSALDAKTFKGLYLQNLDSIAELPDNNFYRKVDVFSGDMLPWHMSLFSFNGTLFTIIACIKKGDKTKKIWQMLGEFNQSLTELKIYQTPLTDYNSYRGSAFVREDGLFVLYSTTVWEKLSGSRSIDGRDVILAKCMFEKLLSQIRGL